MKNVIMLILSISALSLSACKKAEAPAIAPAAKAQPSPPKAVPGSHADWCDEHQVPESMCTKCNPTLAAAFKATGDWCAEHSLPESQCRLCNPQLTIVRPPQKSGE